MVHSYFFKLTRLVEAMVRPRAAPGPPTYEEIDIGGNVSSVTVPIPGKEWFQEHAMFETFQRMVQDPGYGKELNDAALMTQCVMDAACSSADEGGVWKTIDKAAFEV
jgi:hypothetical protein